MKKFLVLLAASAALVGPHALARAEYAAARETDGSAVAAPASEDLPRTAPADAEGAADAAARTPENAPPDGDNYLRDDDYLKPEPGR